LSIIGPKMRETPAGVLRNQKNTFAAVAEEFFKRKLAKTRKGREIERDVRREFVERWAARPIAEIDRHDVMAVIDAVVDRGAPYQAHNLLACIRRLFNWAIGRGIYGLETSPCGRIRPADAIGKKALRKRILDDRELRAFWNATESIRYPYGELFRLLALTGQRKSEVAEARWSEIDLARKLWVIPAERMKADAAHVVPLSDDAVAILKSLPTFKNGMGYRSTHGDYLFDCNYRRSVKTVGDPEGRRRDFVRSLPFIEGTARVLPSAAKQRPSLVAPLADTTRALWRDRAERRLHGTVE
jgi:integrase